MVVVLAERVVVVLPRVEEELPREHLEGHAGQGPHVSCEVVIGTSQHFRSSVLSGLDLSGEVVVLPAGITQISDLDFEPFLQFGSLIKN